MDQNQCKGKNIARIAYGRFKLHWMLDHGFTLDDLIKSLDEYVSDSDEYLSDDFLMWEEEAGFGGMIWPCLDEFLDCEFQNETLIAEYLSKEELNLYNSSRLLFSSGQMMLVAGKKKLFFVTKSDDKSISEFSIHAVSLAELRALALGRFSLSDFIGMDAGDGQMMFEDEYWQLVSDIAQNEGCFTKLYQGPPTSLPAVVVNLCTKIMK